MKLKLTTGPTKNGVAKKIKFNEDDSEDSEDENEKQQMKKKTAGDADEDEHVEEEEEEEQFDEEDEEEEEMEEEWEERKERMTRIQAEQFELDDEENEEEDAADEASGEEEDEENEDEADDEEDEDMMDEDEAEEDASDAESSDRYEEDIEDVKVVQERRKKLPKSVLDDQFFSLAEMNAFLDVQDKVEEEKQRTGRNLGQFDMAEEMETLIRAYEEENLKSRNWSLQGEAVADERRKDELLEQFMDVDYRSAVPPTITEQKTAQLEGIIRKRIKEKLFDDVVRKFRESEALVPVYRNQTAIEQTVRKSLAEVYEEKFAEELNKDGEGTSQVKAELDPTVAAINTDMDSLFLRLDALSHFQFRPQPIREEIKIVNNMPSLHMEEVGPTAAVEPDATLLAPEEVMKAAKRGAPKATEERTETDRKRERRQKKRKQHILASIGAMDGPTEGGQSDDEIQRKKRKKTMAHGRKKLDFANEMQTLISAESGRGKRAKMARK